MKRAFTLVELIVVIAVIAVVATLAVPAYKRVMENGRSAGCQSNLRQLSVGLQSYLQDNEITMPTLRPGREKKEEEVPVIDNTLNKYLPEEKVFACPSDRKFARESGTSYHWNVALNGQKVGNLNFLGMVEQHSRIPVLGDKEGFHPYSENKVNILYADGHASKDVRFFTEQ